MKHILFIIGLLACNAAIAQDTARIVAGTYKGKLPCEECKVIESELELKYGTDTTGEFSLRDKYISEGNTSIMSRIKGDWVMKRDIVDGNKCTVIALDYDNEEKIRYYILRQDGNLVPLDGDKHPLKANMDCTLKKTE